MFNKILCKSYVDILVLHRLGMDNECHRQTDGRTDGHSLSKCHTSLHCEANSKLLCDVIGVATYLYVTLEFVLLLISTLRPHFSRTFTPI